MTETCWMLSNEDKQLNKHNEHKKLNKELSFSSGAGPVKYQAFRGNEIGFQGDTIRDQRIKKFRFNKA